MTQGRRSGYGYNFIERTTSGDHQNVEGPAGETAAVVPGRVSKCVGEGGSIESSSRSMLSLPLWNTSVGESPSRSGFNSHASRARPVASEWKVTPKSPTSGHLDPLGDHQQMVTEVPKPLSRLSAQWSFGTGNDESSRATSVRDSLRKKSLPDFRRYTIDGVKENRAASAVAARDFPSWAKFSSRTRKESCGPGSEKDGVQTRHFSPPSPDLKTSMFRSNFSSYDHRSASSHDVNRPGSWRKRAFGGTERKSRSLDEFTLSEGASDDRVDSGKHGKEGIWRPSSPIPTGYGTENCFPAGEAKRWLPPNALQKGNFSNGADGSESLKISENHTRSTKSGCDSSLAQQQGGDGHYDSFVKATVSNGNGNGSKDFGVETNEFRMASTELRDNAIDGEERRSGGVGMIAEVDTGPR